MFFTESMVVASCFNMHRSQTLLSRLDVFQQSQREYATASAAGTRSKQKNALCLPSSGGKASKSSFLLTTQKGYVGLSTLQTSEIVNTAAQEEPSNAVTVEPNNNDDEVSNAAKEQMSTTTNVCACHKMIPTTFVACTNKFVWP